ncbi:MAG: FecR domain-containing protein [Oscillospiraceae bacterium]|nr:FecR domain-containing protein [Oscillospiraceae bacterium]
MTKETLKKFILPTAIAVAAVVAIVIAVVVAGNKEEIYRLIKVKSFEGAVIVQREEKMEAFEGLQLISEDSVEVGDASFLELLADSDKHIVAEENTAFVLHSTGTETSGNITINLLYGKSLFTIDNKLNDESTFEVKTPNATMSVRGTSFSVEYNAVEEVTIVEVHNGKVHVSCNSGEIQLEEGDSATIKGSNDDVEIIEELDNGGNDETTTTAVTTTVTENYEENPIPEPSKLEAFEVRYSNTLEYSGIHVMFLKEWGCSRTYDDPEETDVFTNGKVFIRYWAYTAAEVDEQLRLSEKSGHLEKIEYFTSDDGKEITAQTYNFNGTNGDMEIAYEYFEKINDDLYLSLLVFDRSSGEYLKNTDITTYLPLMNDSYYTYSLSGDID